MCVCVCVRVRACVCVCVCVCVRVRASVLVFPPMTFWDSVGQSIQCLMISKWGGRSVPLPNTRHDINCPTLHFPAPLGQTWGNGSTLSPTSPQTAANGTWQGTVQCYLFIFFHPQLCFPMFTFFVSFLGFNINVNVSGSQLPISPDPEKYGCNYLCVFYSDVPLRPHMLKARMWFN